MNQMPDSDELSAVLREKASYHAAPADLRQAILDQSRPAPSVRSAWSRRFGQQLAWLLSSFAAGAMALWMVLPAPVGQPAMQALLVDSHLRSLQAEHLTDVPSSDQHTVKPWFAGKLDYTPPVKDFADDGFPLQGGRLEVIEGRATAVLVYGYRLHVINMFIHPAPGKATPPRALVAYRGFQLVQCQAEGMAFTLVSDASNGNLLRLAGHLCPD
jgi:anti-sigma factor RsiW